MTTLLKRWIERIVRSYVFLVNCSSKTVYKINWLLGVFVINLRYNETRFLIVSGLLKSKKETFHSIMDMKSFYCVRKRTVIYELFTINNKRLCFIIGNMSNFKDVKELWMMDWIKHTTNQNQQVSNENDVLKYNGIDSTQLEVFLMYDPVKEMTFMWV